MAISRPTATTVVVVASVLVAVVVEATASGTAVGTACYLAVVVGAGAGAWLGVRRWPREHRLAPSLIAVGVSLNAAGEVVWTALDESGLNPDVSVADLAWVSSYVALCAALWVVLKRTRRADDLNYVIDAVTVVVVSVLAFWRFSIEAIVADDTLSPLVRATWAAYPVLDAVLLALVFRLLVSRSSRTTVAVWFAGGVCLWLTADVLYLHVATPGVLQTLMDVAWMLGPVLMARAAWPAAATRAVAPRRADKTGVYVGQLLLAVCPLMVPPALELVADLSDQPDRPGQLLVGTAVLIVLALVRTGRLIRSEQHARRELVAARDAALAASEAKSIFLANMSHEVRTPLTAVLASGELLAASALDASQVKLLEIMRRSGHQLLSLVENILDFSRLEAGDAVFSPSAFRLPTLAVEVVARHRERAEQKGIALELDVDPRVGDELVGDRTRVVEVLDQLIDNALKFTEAGQVRLSVRPAPAPGRPTGVVLSVTDTGIGINTEDQERVFETFQQVDGKATRRYGGTGLGLAICRRATELMGGTISLQSRPGAGSTFSVWLPLTPPSASAARAVSAVDDLSRRRPPDESELTGSPGSRAVVS